MGLLSSIARPFMGTVARDSGRAILSSAVGLGFFAVGNSITNALTSTESKPVAASGGCGLFKPSPISSSPAQIDHPSTFRIK